VRTIESVVQPFAKTLPSSCSSLYLKRIAYNQAADRCNAKQKRELLMPPQRYICLLSAWK